VLSRLFQLSWYSSARRELLLFALLSVVAIGVGFVFVTPFRAEKLIVHYGYYYILALFCAALFFGWRIWREGQAPRLGTTRQTVLIWLGLAAATGFAMWTDAFGHKVLFDEYVLQATAAHMHATKEIGTPLRAYDIAGTWLTIDTFLDKRPYFFVFLISLIHDLTGFRVANAFGLNVALTFAILGMTFWLVRTLTSRIVPAFFAVALLATMPLFGQNATGAGMEMHNLAMIAATVVVGALYLQAPDGNRLSLLVLCTALLAQSRYESVIFVVPVAVLIVIGWLRANRVLLPWLVVIAPLFFVPYAWHNRFVAAKPALWQLREGESSRFSLQYLAGNLDGAWNFFFATSRAQPNSLWLTLLGLIGIGWVAYRFWRRLRSRADERAPLPPVFIAAAVCSTAIAANMALLMFYYWSRLDEPVAARFALPTCWILAISAAGLVHALDLRRLPATRIAVAGLAVWLLGFGVPAYAKRLYSTQNLVTHELNWELERVHAFQSKGRILLITNKALVPFLLQRISAVTIGQAQLRVGEIAWHMKQGTFRDVLVSQVIRPTSPQGDQIVDPDDQLPASFQLETLEQKRVGGRWIRISRLVDVVPKDSVRTEAVTEPAVE
jgi:hypothetical protein